jgi:hypothetical protein
MQSHKTWGRCGCLSFFSHTNMPGGYSETAPNSITFYTAMRLVFIIKKITSK